MNQAELALTPNRAIFSVFGNIMNDPDLLRNPEVLLTERDFTSDFHKIIFVALHNITYNDSKVSTVTSVDIDNYIASYPTHYKIWNDNKGMNFVEDAMKTNNESLFKTDYEKVKKFSLLRNYVESGIDVSDIFDYKSNDLKAISEGNKRIEQMSIPEIIEHYTQKAISIRDEWHIADGTVKDFKAGDGIFDLLERLQQNPDLGYPFPNLMYNTLFRGMRKGKFLLRSGSTGTGKAIVHGTKIPTPQGWKVVEDIRVGDELFDRKGKRTNVIGVYPQGKQQVYRVTLKDGRYVDCNAEHLWETISGKNKRKTMTTLEILEKINDFKGKGYPISILSNEAVEYEHKDLPLDPYVLGACLGDGCITKDGPFGISSGNDNVPLEVAKRLGTTISKNPHNCTYHFNIPEEYDFKTYKYNKKHLYNHEVLGELSYLIGCRSETKYIPEEYMVSSIDQRRLLLQGLLDTDGSVGSRDETRQSQIGYYSTSTKLLKQVSELAFSLGYNNSIKPSKDGKGGAIHFNIKSSDVCEMLLATPEKISRIEKNKDRKDKILRDRVKIVKIEALEEYKDQVCFTVDNDESLFLVGDYVVTHNTRQAINDMLEVTCSHKWETGKGWVSLGPQFPALFISTELEQEELQTIMLAFVTGIPDSEIKDGNYDAATAKRLQEGLKIISEAPFFLSYIEDFSISDIEMKIEQYIINEGVQYVAFDYIQMTPKLSKSMSANFGVTLREDQILVHFSAALKTIASQYQIFLESSTQLNRGSKEVENRDATSLRGGMATADKIDYGVLTFKVNQKDLNNLKPILERGFQQKTPNYSHWVYKNRAGMDYVVVWSKIDLGTMREEILFVTDYDYNPVEMSGLEIKFEEVEEDISF